jgi:hypothetical protein
VTSLQPKETTTIITAHGVRWQLDTEDDLRLPSIPKISLEWGLDQQQGGAQEFLVQAASQQVAVSKSGLTCIKWLEVAKANEEREQKKAAKEEARKKAAAEKTERAEKMRVARERRQTMNDKQGREALKNLEKREALELQKEKIRQAGEMFLAKFKAASAYLEKNQDVAGAYKLLLQAQEDAVLKGYGSDEFRKVYGKELRWMEKSIKKLQELLGAEKEKAAMEAMMEAAREQEEQEEAQSRLSSLKYSHEL